MNKIYQVAGHRFMVSGKELCTVTEGIAGFKPFEVQQKDALFVFLKSADVPIMDSVQYTFKYEDVTGTFGRRDDCFILTLKPKEEDALHLWRKEKEKQLWLHGNLSVRLYRFALWVGYGLMTLPYDTVAIHSSCIIYQDKAVLFLGESGTGKSTHTHLWNQHIKNATLLNDDSPILRVENGTVWAYGSPWSGKTPCYKSERHELKACVRLSQAPYNRITKLSVLHAYGAIHPSCPPEFAYDNNLYSHVSDFIGKLLSEIPFYHLSCLPNKEAALLSCRTIFQVEI